MNEQFPRSENQNEEIPVMEGVDVVFDQNPELAEIGTQEQYSEYLDTIFPESNYKQIFLHGTQSSEKFEAEDWNEGHTPASAKNFGAGYYFSADKDIAERYNHNGEGRTLYTVLNIQNPVFTDINKNDNKGLLYAGSASTAEIAGPEKDAVINIEYADRDNFSPYNKYLLAYSGPVDQSGFPAKQEVHMKIPTVSQLAVIDKSQIHILGSKKDIEGFKEFVG